eukprot:Awhi_evm1s6998
MAAARQIGRVFNYGALAEIVPNELKAELSALRSKHSSLKETLNSLPEKPVAIDFASYSGKINPAVISATQKSYQSLVYPRTPDTFSSELAALKKKQLEVAEAEIKAADVEIARLNGELAKIHARKPLEELTIEDVLADKPEWEREINDDIKNHRWPTI